MDTTTTKLGLLYKTRSLFNETTALALYKALITPHFDYGCLLYEIAPEYQLKRLQTVQNAAARLILSERFDAPIYQLHERLHLDTLATRRLKTMVQVTFSCLHTGEPTYLNDNLQPVEHMKAGAPVRQRRACFTYREYLQTTVKWLTPIVAHFRGTLRTRYSKRQRTKTNLKG